MPAHGVPQPQAADDLKRAEKIFVYKLDNRDLTDDEIFGLHDALRRYGEAALLCVRKQNEHKQNGLVEVARPGLMVAYIDRFSEELPDGHMTVSLQSWSVICRKAHELWQRDRRPSTVQPIQSVPSSVTDANPTLQAGQPGSAELLMHFESLGGDYPGCEIGLVQRRFGAEPLGLLRWTTIQPRGLVKALGAKFEGVGDPQQTEIYTHRNSYKAKDRLYGMDMVTFVRASSLSREEMLTRLTKRLKFLREKLLADLGFEEKIFVYRTLRDHLSVHEVIRIKKAMSMHGKNKLLYIRLADAKHRPGDVESVQDDLAFGYVAQFSREPVRELYMEGWQRMFERAADLWLSSSVAGAASSRRAAS